jgi:hypothetical protein
LDCSRNFDRALLCGDQDCRQNPHIITTPRKCWEFFIAPERCDSGPAPLPMGNGRAMIGQSNWQFSKNDLKGSSAIPGSDT